jgi:hypothetical protein
MLPDDGIEIIESQECTEFELVYNFTGLPTPNVAFEMYWGVQVLDLMFQTFLQVYVQTM